MITFSKGCDDILRGFRRYVSTRDTELTTERVVAN